MVVFLFPGQGSQKRGMGEGLFDAVAEFAAVEKEIDALLGYSIRKLCLEDPDGRLKETQYTQPALYIVNALHAYRAMQNGERADFLAGHSLGEYNALLAAGAFDLVTGLKLVKRRGELMGQAKDGGMAAVIGLDAERIASLIAEHQLTGLDVANYNTAQQTVISGPLADIGRAQPVMEQAGAKLFAPLAVSAAFHSRYMAGAGSAFADFLGSFNFNELKIPVVSNVTGELYPRGNPNEAIRPLLAKQISSPVRWSQSMRFLIGAGAKTFKEMGPGTVLTRLVQQIEKEAG